MPATGIRLAEMMVLEMAVGFEMGPGSAAGTAYAPNMLAAIPAAGRYARPRLRHHAPA